MSTHEHRWNTVVATGKWAETDWQVLGCECGAVTVRPRISSDQAGFWEVDPQGSFRAVQPLIVASGPAGDPASDNFHTSAGEMSDWSSFRAEDRPVKERKSVRELVRDEAGKAREASRRFNAERTRSTGTSGAQQATQQGSRSRRKARSQTSTLPGSRAAPKG